MKTNKFTKLLIASSIIVSSWAFADSDKVVATYKGTTVKDSQVMDTFKDNLKTSEEYKNKKFSELPKELQQKLVASYVQPKILEQEALSSGIEKNKDFQSTLDRTKKSLMMQWMLEEYVKKNFAEKMIDEKYEKLYSSRIGKEGRRLSSIIVSKEETAKKVKQELAKGTSFAELAKQFSEDGSTNTKGGDLGWFIQGELSNAGVAELDKKVFELKSGTVSEPIKIQSAYYIIKVDEIGKIPEKSLPTKDSVKPMLQNKVSQELQEKFMDELNKKYEVKYLL